MKIPAEIKLTIDRLSSRGFEAYAVGGCVRDFLLDRQPGDWDVTTSATPEQIQKIFTNNFYENNFGTVTIITNNPDPVLSEIEITPFRNEGKYSDQRHPDEISWAANLKEDLSRRDFTINAMATTDGQKIIDPYDGQADLKQKLIRTVGKPTERFAEDALRLMRAPRLAIQLGFDIEEKTQRAIQENATALKMISGERIRDELNKILMSLRATEGIYLLKELGLLRYILPELEEGWEIDQNKHHAYTVFEHSVRALDYAAKENYELSIRLAALFHDIAKPRTKMGSGPECHFYGHDVISARVVAQIMGRLKYPRQMIDKITRLIKSHMFIYNTNPEQGAVTTDAAVRRIIRRVGEDNIWDLARLRLADRAGSGVKKIEKFDNRHFKFRVEKLLREPLSAKMLAVNGHDIMENLSLKPDPRIGWLINTLLQEILDNPSKNTRDYLLKRLEELNRLSDDTLKDLADESKREVGLYEEQEEGKIKEKYWVK